MGHGSSAVCRKCGTSFEANEGGGFFFHPLHCDQCGRERVVRFEKLGVLHEQYIKGLSVPYCIMSSASDAATQARDDIEPLTEIEYHAAVERKQRKCRCGGRFRFGAPPRCPKCRSMDWDPTGGFCCYD